MTDKITYQYWHIHHWCRKPRPCHHQAMRVLWWGPSTPWRRRCPMSSWRWLICIAWPKNEAHPETPTSCTGWTKEWDSVMFMALSKWMNENKLNPQFSAAWIQISYSAEFLVISTVIPLLLLPLLLPSLSPFSLPPLPVNLSFKYFFSFFKPVWPSLRLFPFRGSHFL